MQAIQSIENAKMEVPHRSSPFRALIWKEWRQQRWIFLSLAGMAYGLLVLSLIIPPELRNGVNWQDAFYGLAAVVGVAGIVVISTNAFAGEHEESSDLFLETIPCSRSKLFWSKLGFVFLLGLFQLPPAAAGAVRFNEQLVGGPMSGVALGLLIVAGLITPAIIPALIASLGGSVIATTLASLPILLVCVVYFAISPDWLAQFLPSMESEVGKDVMGLLLGALMLATILLAARRAWIRPERAWRGSLRAPTATAGLLIGYVAVPAAAAYLYVTFFASPAFFLDYRNDFARDSAPAPNGNYVAFESRYAGWEHTVGRAALMDMNTGRAEWLTRFRVSVLRAGGRLWSPSGNQLVLTELDLRLWPHLWNPSERKPACAAYFVVDARSGLKRSLDELCPGLPQMSDVMSSVGWCNEDVLAFRNSRDIFFADIENHAIHRCRMPTALWRGILANWPLVTRRGVFEVPYEAWADGGFSVLRYAADLPEAERLVLRGMSKALAFDWSSRAGVRGRVQASEDGQWLLVNSGASDSRQDWWYLVRLADGAQAALLASTNPHEEGLMPSSWRVTGFLPGGHQILLFSMTELGLFDPDRHDLRRIQLEETRNYLFIRWAELSPVGGFTLLDLGQAPGVAFDRNEAVGPGYFVVDLKRGTVGPKLDMEYGPRPQWLGEDRLLFDHYAENKWQPWIINRDGTGARPLLAK